jgi:hypothetical protein
MRRSASTHLVTVTATKENGPVCRRAVVLFSAGRVQKPERLPEALGARRLDQSVLELAVCRGRAERLNRSRRKTQHTNCEYIS